MTSNRSRYDVVVVGGRVTGSATAMLLTISTHSIARSGVIQLQRWELLDAVLDSGTPAIRQVTFHALGESVSRTIKPAQPLGPVGGSGGAAAVMTAHRWRSPTAA